jgi:hypothetical protein
LSPDAGDHHVHNLAQLVVALKPPVRDVVLGKPPLMHKVKSTDEQEEVEKES